MNFAIVRLSLGCAAGVAGLFALATSAADVRYALPEPEGAAWPPTLAASRYGCEGVTAPVERTPAPSDSAQNHRVEYAGRAGGAPIDEWYERGPRGVEHGFTLIESPCARGNGELEIQVTDPLLRPLPREDGRGVDLVDAQGTPRAHYTDLGARDATGAALAGTMTVEDGVIVLRVDARDARFPVIVDPLEWFETQVLTVDGGDAAFFGNSVALSGPTALVGAPNATVGANALQGAAYVFTQSNATFGLQTELVSTDGVAGDGFGGAVAVSGAIAVVGAAGRSVGGVSPGAAYVFTQSGGTWSQQQEFLPADSEGAALFGSSVSVSGGTLVIGAPFASQPAAFAQGSVHVFTQTGATWSLQQQLWQTDATGNNTFGHAVSLSGDTLLVGANNKAIGMNGSQGAAYVYVRSGGTWTLQQELQAADGIVNDQFGSCVAVSGDTAVVSGYSAAYVYVRSGTAWSLQQELKRGTEWSLSLSAGVLMLSDGPSRVFTLSGTTWSPQLSDLPPASATSLSGSLALLGQGVDGIAYIATTGPANGGVCTAPSDCGSGHCVSGICCDTACGPCGDCGAGACTLLPGSAGTPSCAPFVCSATSATCPATCAGDGDCVSGDYCTASAQGDAGADATVDATSDGGAPGQCIPRSALGAPCAFDDQCASGSCVALACRGTLANGAACTANDECSGNTCVDGVCCNVPCAGECEACDVAGSSGVCSPVVGAPHGARAACAGTGTACGGACDGNRDPLQCLYPPATTACGTACSNDQQTSSTCDGTGRCVAGTPQACGSYACGGVTCNTSCAAATDCATGFVCTGARCTPQQGSICVGARMSQPPGGAVTDCAPYACGTSGACNMSCATVKDCAAPNVCDPSGHCVAVPSTASPGGCGCRAAGGRGSSPREALVGAALATLVVFGRRRPANGRPTRRAGRKRFA